MRALKLHLKNIGPFLDETVDFSALGDMFLVSGRTGSGKTTIFDSMIYALYGDVCGVRKKAIGEFRSDFSAPEDESFVEFMFALNGRTFRVRRTLPGTYINRNGKTAVRPSEVMLEQFNEQTNSFSPFNGKTNETNEKIVDIIGLNSTEFTQIVLLPQGAFADFLHENSKNRRDTLSKLFPVDAYEGIVELAKQKSVEYADRRRLLETQITELAQEYNDETAAAELADMDSNLEELTGTRKLLTKEIENLRVEEERMRTALSATLQAEQWMAQKAELEKQRPEIKTVQQKAARAEQARKIGEYIRRRNDALLRVRQLEADKIKAEQEAVSAEQTYSGFAARTDEMAALQKSITDHRLVLQQMESRRKLLQGLQNIRKKAAGAEQARVVADQRLSDAERDTAALLEKMRILAGETGETGETADASGILQLLLEKRQTAETARTRAESSLETAKNVARLQSRLDTVREQLEKEIAQITDIDSQIHNTQCCLTDYEAEQKQQERNNYACALVGQLEEGRPCPVCGSLSHPSPAVRLPETLGLAGKIDTQKKNLAVLVQRRAEMDADRAGLDAEQKQLRLSLDELAASGFVDVESASAEAERNRVGVETAIAAYGEAQRLFARWKESQAAADRLADELHASERAVSASAAELETLEGQVSSEDTAERLTERIQKLSESVDADGKTYRAYDAGFRKAENERTACRMKLQTVSENLAAALEDQTQTVGELDRHVKDSCFSDAEEAGRALVSDIDLELLNNRIKKWQEAFDRVSIQLESVKPAGKSDDIRINLDRLAAQAEEKRKAAVEADGTIQSVTVKRAGLLDRISKWRDLEQKRRDIEEKSAHYTKLSADLSGQNPKKVPFDAWILGMYFSEVVAFANPRFERISGGRYRFKISTELSGGNSLRGLDLLVSDSYTGRDRDTATLSGGETFMASISLALALTDVVQNRSGGIRLDSLFIDEGFGTLDGESLDMAISVLQDIRESRVVGVISHVESMKTAIPSRLEITKGADGSHIHIR